MDTVLLRAGLLSIFAGLPAVGAAADEFSGHIEVGVRQVDVQGDENKYEQYENLDDGARLFGMSVRFEPDSAQAPAPDLVDISLSGFGGDPHESVAVTVKKYGAYRFRYNRHRSDYLYDDLLIAPADASVEGSTGGDFHHFDFERTRDSASLGVDLTDRAKLTFDFDRYAKTGDSTTVLDVEREEFDLEQPIDETLRASTLGFQYSWERVTLIVTERWQEHENDFSWFLPGASLGLQPEEPTELDFFFLDQPYESDAREHGLGLRLRPVDDLQLSLDVKDIELELDLDVAERSQGLDYTGTPFARDLRGAGDVERDATLIEAGASFAATDRLQIGATVRRYGLEQNGAVLFEGNTATSDWDIDNTGFELSAQMLVTDALRLAAGWHSERRDAEFIEVTAAGTFLRDERTDHDGFFLQTSYQPDKRLKLTLSVEDNRIDDPFTLASATDSRRYRLRGQFRFGDGFALVASHKRTEHENDNSDWESVTEQTDLRLNYVRNGVRVSAGLGLLDLENEIEQTVAGGFRSDVFDIRYRADATFWDADAEFEVNENVTLYAGFRQYENDGSFDIERDQAQAGIDYALPRDYVLTLGYRNTDYDEDGLESYEADIWELSLRYDW